MNNDLEELKKKVEYMNERLAKKLLNKIEELKKHSTTKASLGEGKETGKEKNGRKKKQS